MTKIPESLETTELTYIIDSSKIEQKQLSNEKLQSLTNNDFLKIPKENRLKYITQNNITSNDLLKDNLRIKNIDFNFTFD